MRALLIGMLLVVTVHSVLTLGARVQPEKLSHTGRFLARVGMVLGIFLPRVRTLIWYVMAISPFLHARAQSQTGARDTHTANTGKMTLSEAREILNVSEEASEEEINRAWRQLMKKHHPDQGGTADGARRLNTARQLLLESLGKQ